MSFKEPASQSHYMGRDGNIHNRRDSGDQDSQVITVNVAIRRNTYFTAQSKKDPEFAKLYKTALEKLGPGRHFNRVIQMKMIAIGLSERM